MSYRDERNPAPRLWQIEQMVIDLERVIGTYWEDEYIEVEMEGSQKPWSLTEEQFQDFVRAWKAYRGC